MGLLQSPGHSGASAARGESGKAANSPSACAEKIPNRAAVWGGCQFGGVAGSVIGTLAACGVPPFLKKEFNVFNSVVE